MKRGKFVVPNKKWLKECFEIEKKFNDFHSPLGVKKGPGIRENFFSLISNKFPHQAEKILKLVVQLRTDIRTKSVNFNVIIKKKKKATQRAQRKVADY